MADEMGVSILTRNAKATRGCVLLLAAMFVPGEAQPPVAAPEDEVKSALLLGFARYTEWPAGGGAGGGVAGGTPLMVGVSGHPTLTRALSRVFAGKSVGGRPLEARNVQTAEQAAPCHVLYIAGGSRKQLEELLGAVRDAPVLTIGESDALIALGGIVQLFEEDGKIRFAVSIEALNRSRLNINARLLRLGHVVRARER